MVLRIAIACAMLCGVARAEPALDRAKAAVERSDYLAARTALEQARVAGGHSPEETADLYRLTGLVAGALGETKAAEAAFATWLSLDPKAALPAGTSPKIARPFDAAKLRSKALAVKVETSSQPPALTLVVERDPAQLIAKARVTFVVDGGAEQVREVVASERTTIALPAGRRIDARVAALDAQGDRLAEIGSAQVPIVIVGDAPVVVAKPVIVRKPDKAPPPPEPFAARPIYARWWPYAGAAIVFGGAAVGFGLAARSAAHDLDALDADSVHHSYDEAQAVERRARRDVLITNISLGAAGACALAAGIFYVTAPRRAETRLSAVPTRGGGAVVLGGSF